MAVNDPLQRRQEILDKIETRLFSVGTPADKQSASRLEAKLLEILRGKNG
jgi:hypothetical protein